MPGLGTGVRGSFAADQRVACAQPRRSRLRRNFRSVQQSACRPSATTSEQCGWITYFSAKDSLSAVYTIDDSEDFTPTSTNLYSTDVETLREQVASIDETHVFSASLLNTARVGFSRAGYFFTGEPTPGTPAASLPGFLAGLPLGALVVGGSAASNPTAQLSLAGSNNGSNLDVARNLFTYEDRVSCTKGRHQFTVGAWFQRLRSNENSGAQPVRPGDVHQPADLSCREPSATLLYDPAPTPLGWRSWFGAWYAEDMMRLTPRLTLIARLPRRIHHRVE